MDPSDLHCIICPGDPRFSDVSHLLTHVASKAHLSHSFKLQVRARQNEGANLTLKDYDAWYKANDLDTLLTHRLNTKDDRQKKRKQQMQPDDEDFRPPRSIKRPRRSKKTVESPAVNDAQAPQCLDPRLMGPLQSTGSTPQHYDASPMLYPVASASPAYDGTRRITRSVINRADANAFANAGYFINPTEDDDQRPARMSYPELPVTPNAKSSRSKIDLNLGVPWDKKPELFLTSYTHWHTSAPAPESALDDDEMPSRERADEIARLKGVLWPGMNIFDSATHQQRRRRNQKKDGTLLKRMKITSALTEPTEQIFSPDGELLKERVISGNVDEDTPLKGEIPVPKWRPSKPKKLILCPKDPNVPIVKRARKKPTAAVLQTHAQLDRGTYPRRSHSPVGIHHPTYLEDPDIQLSLQAYDKAPRSDFAIFADSDHHGKEGFRNQTLGPNSPQHTLTPTKLVLNHRANIPKHLGRHNFHTGEDKENVEPILNPREDIDMCSWDSPLAKRGHMNQARYKPEFLFVKREGDEDGKHNIHTNPLYVPNSKMAMSYYGDGAYDFNPAGSGEWDMQREQSSEATISESDHQEFTRLFVEGNND